jgi:hypothetical protein
MQCTALASMTWAQLTPDNAFLILSVLAGAGAVGVLLREILRSKLHNVSHPDPTMLGQHLNELENKKQQPSLLDKITLLNKNLIQCPRCFTFDFAHARFCTRCGTSIQSYGEMPTHNLQYAEARYLTQDESTRIFGLSMKIDPKTRIGVIIGIQNREAPEQISETRE